VSTTVRPPSWFLLALVSGLGLFLELAVIRWLSAEVRLFSYFKNLPLLAAFLGLALGFGLVGCGRDYRRAFAPLLAIFAALVLLIGRTDPQFLAYPGSADEFLFFTASPTHWLAAARFLGVVLVFFVLTMLVFVPLGQATGEEMTGHAPLEAYIVNVAASLLGVWAFALLSFLETPPVVWFAAGLAGAGLYLGRRGALSPVAVGLFVLVVGALGVLGRGAVWSPYQRLEVRELLIPDRSGAPMRAGWTLSVQRVFFMHAYDLSPPFLERIGNRLLEDISRSYSLPYGLHPSARNVLIVGAGMGNDAAAAVRNGVVHLDAVEIDPTILALGRRLHPERPYEDARVRTVADDARSFLKQTAERYDLIVFGFLDSHILLSGLSSIRLDSFVYTRESFLEARGRLADGGLMVVSFSQSPEWLRQRLGRMLIETFGADRVYVRRGLMGTTFVAGPVPAERLAAAELAPWRPQAESVDLPLSTDDWPYLYLRGRVVPAAYWQILLVVGAVCFLVIARAFPSALRPSWQFWFLGAAFLLIEFKSITELALLFGATWLVNALAISGVLVMVLAANAVALRRPGLPLGPVYGLLFASIVLAYLFPLDALNALGAGPRAAVSMVLLSLPLFFAGLIFAEALREAGEAARPLASNLSGAVAGGVLEYGSLVWGVKSLYVIGAVVYAGAFLASRGRRP
jgi:hypothetical protein